MKKRIEGTLSLPKRRDTKETRPRAVRESRDAQPNELKREEPRHEETDPPVPARSREESASEDASAEATRGEDASVEAERLLGREEIASFRARYGLEPEEFDALYRSARGAAPQYGIDYSADIAALKQRCAALKELIAAGDAPSLRARLLAQALQTYGAMARARDAALNRKG